MKPDIDEVLGYLGAGTGAPVQLRARAAETAQQLSAALSPRFVYRVFPLSARDGRFCLTGSGVTLTGRTAQIMLQDCQQAALLCCTLGARFEIMLRQAQVRDMAQAVILDACGSAYTEAGCDAAGQELAARFPTLHLTDRFSPGYGDLPLCLQKDICTALDAPRRLGVQVTEQFLLNPCKSVTAIIGLSDRPQMARVRGCSHCSMAETCTFRKGGHHCGI